MGPHVPDIPPPPADGGSPDQPPEGTQPPPGAPAPRRGLSNNWIAALVIVAFILVAFGICVTVTR